MIGKKIVIHSSGSYDHLNCESFEVQKPGKGEVLIKVKCCGINFADACVRMGVYSSAKKYVGWPITPGFEVSGEVIAQGEGANRYAVGSKVIALTRFGGYSSHLSVKEDQVYPLPENWSFEEGASFPSVFLTAWYALCELAHPQAGDALLIHSAAGGVGSALVQIGKTLGCKVVGVVGASHKKDAVLKLGADAVIDKSSERLWEEAERLFPEGYQVILDANGAETLAMSYKHLASAGKLVVYGFHTMFSKGKGTPNWLKMAYDWWRTPRFNPLEMTGDNKSVLAFNLSYLFSKMDRLNFAMQTLLKWQEAGKIKPPQITTYPFDQVKQAHRDLESAMTIGKLVLRVE